MPWKCTYQHITVSRPVRHSILNNQQQIKKRKFVDIQEPLFKINFPLLKKVLTSLLACSGWSSLMVLDKFCQFQAGKPA